MLGLPETPPRRKMGAEITEMRGLWLGDGAQAGDLADSEGISTRRWPCLSPRRARQRQEGYDGRTALTGWDRLIAVRGTDLLCAGEKVGTVSPGEKQFAVVNTRLVIWPDKLSLDLKTLRLSAMEARVECTGAEFETGSVKLSGCGDMTELFSAGDGVSLSGCVKEEGNNKDFVIKQVTADTITVTDKTFTKASESGALTIKRSVPDMDFICESENRLWGCSSGAQTIYASALGDVNNFNVFQGVSTDSFAVAVGSQGDFTGCCRLGSSVLFFKQDTLHKILGSYPAEYCMYSYVLEGLRAGCHKTMQVINEVLFYMGAHGVYAYSGGSPSLVSAGFGQLENVQGTAGSDGERYYLSCADASGDWRLLVYDTRAGLWVKEDRLRCVDFARVGQGLYFLDGDGAVWLADSGEDDPGLEWSAQYAPFYETAQGKKRHSRLILRLELPRGSYMRAEIRCDGGRWREVWRAYGTGQALLRAALPPARCDRFELRLSGRGPFALLSMTRRFAVGSEV